MIASYSFSFRDENGRIAAVIVYKDKFDPEYQSEQKGTWTAPFTPDQPIYGLLESVGQTDSSLETPASIVQQAMFVYGEPSRVRVLVGS